MPKKTFLPTLRHGEINFSARSLRLRVLRTQALTPGPSPTLWERGDWKWVFCPKDNRRIAPLAEKFISPILVRNLLLRNLLLIGIALTLTACNKQDTPGDKPAGSSAAIVTKSGVEMVSVPAGTFTMGSDQGDPDEAPAHKVSISAFLMDKYPVTHQMFVNVQLPDPSHWHEDAGQDNPRGPVERVRWRDAKQYCNERSRLEGLKPCYDEKTLDWECDYSADGYRLPTEAEWEYAARAGTDGPYDFGSKESLRQYAWFADNSEQKTHPVGQKKPNKWGLYDMYGNVSVWCEDVYDPNYYKTSPAADPPGPPSPTHDVRRVLRGGNWKVSAEMCRVTRRQGEHTGDTDACFATDYCGLRCVRRVTPEQLAQLRNPKN